MLYSSSMAQVGARYLTMQLVWCVLGLAACLATTLVDYRQLKKIWWVLFSLAVVMLVLVLNQHIGRGSTARAALVQRLEACTFQPSEFAKLALIVALAWYGEHFQRQMPSWKRGILVPGLLIGLTVGLIFTEPDVGNALVLATVSGSFAADCGHSPQVFPAAGARRCYRYWGIHLPQPDAFRAHLLLAARGGDAAGQGAAGLSGDGCARQRRPHRQGLGRWPPEARLRAGAPHGLHLFHHRRGARADCHVCW